MGWIFDDLKQNRFYSVCESAAANDDVFKTFRKIDAIQLIISSLENPIGTALWDKQMIGLGKPVESFVSEIDQIGDPMMEERLDGQLRSREMTRFLYLFHDMLQLFGQPRSIIEIGGGFGAMAALFCRSMDVDYTIIDRFQVGLLQKRFCQECNVEIETLVDDDWIDRIRPDYDLVISTYCYDELDVETQDGYLPIMSRCKNGYFTSKASAREYIFNNLPIQHRRMAPDGFDYAEIMYW